MPDCTHHFIMSLKQILKSEGTFDEYYKKINKSSLNVEKIRRDKIFLIPWGDTTVSAQLAV